MRANWGGIARYPAISEKHRCDRYSDTLQCDYRGGRAVALREK